MRSAPPAAMLTPPRKFITDDIFSLPKFHTYKRTDTQNACQSFCMTTDIVYSSHSSRSRWAISSSMNTLAASGSVRRSLVITASVRITGGSMGSDTTS